MNPFMRHPVRSRRFLQAMSAAALLAACGPPKSLSMRS
jgi:hypothetical protein